MMHHLPNFITLLNVTVGALGCLALTQGYEPFYFVLLAGILDFSDGLAARMLKASSSLGAQLDSLADLVSFGVLPALALAGSAMSVGHETASVSIMLPLLIVPFSAFRLAWFNLDETQKQGFRGLPTPANAFMITSLLYVDLVPLDVWALGVLTLLSCALLVAPIRLLALKFTHWGWRGNEWRFMLIFVVLVGLAIWPYRFLPFIIPVYLVISVLGNYVLADKRSFFK
jgi:CDP-diacylglycerol--serine O-phosphatidyltransferase